MAVIIGPTGGGKTQAAARKILRVALNQYPSPRDGVRKCRIVVVCPTYRRAWDTVIPSYKKVWGKVCPDQFKGAKGDPADHVMDFPMVDPATGAECWYHIEVLFRAVRDESLEEFVRGFETTAWWFPEMDTMHAEDLLSLASNRVGRYPEPDDRPLLPPGSSRAYAGVWGDANAPVIGGWFHTRFYLERDKHTGSDLVFRQPPGLLADGTPNPQAENLQNLNKIRDDYYPWLASTMEDYDIGRLLKCKPGYSRLGKPVFEDFDEFEMVADTDIQPDPRLPVLIGTDAGSSLHPAAAFMQRAPSGELRILHEICPWPSAMSLEELGAEMRRIFDTCYRPLGCTTAVIIGDPALAVRGAEKKIPFGQTLQAAAGMRVQLAESNVISTRLAAVNKVLKRKRGASLLVNPSCVRIIAALTGGYAFKKVGNVYSPKPGKDEHSDPADAVQYGCMGVEGAGAAYGGVISPPSHASHGEASSIPAS